MSAWSPPGGSRLSEVDIGLWWDVVQSAEAVGPQALGAELVRTAHIVSPDEGRRSWLVPPGSVSCREWGWARISRYITIRTAGSGTLAVPHADWTAGPGPHWARPHGWRGEYLSAPLMLNAALDEATLVLGPPALWCPVCRWTVWREEAVRVVIPSRRGGWDEHTVAHPLCARRAGLATVPPA